jgi:cation transport protein ChaC
MRGEDVFNCAYITWLKMIEQKAKSTMNELSQGFWVFGYGSLMWTPEFEFEECVPAELLGYARSFCMWSVHHRGTPQEPGLVLALEALAGARCTGLAFRVSADTAVQCLADLRERELINSAYHEHFLPVTLGDGRSVAALAYVMDLQHEQYTGPLSLEDQAEVIARAHGGRGPNSEYLFNTSTHLNALGMADPDMTQLSEMVQELLSK